MAEIRPFRGIRPSREKAAAVAALPYDVYTRKEAEKEVERNPESFLKVDRAETQFPLSVGMYEDRVYQRAHDTLWKLVEDGTLIREDRQCYYLYELTMNERVQTGIVACASIDDYMTNVIKKHEQTRQEKEEDRIRHVDVCSAQTGPIFLAYRANDVIREVIAEEKKREAEYDFVSGDGIRHRVFVIRDDAATKKIADAFAGIDSIYIADGHHRAASAVKVGLKRRKEHPDYTGEEAFNYFLSVLFADDELMIMGYHRVIRDLNGYSFQGFYREMTKRFELSVIRDTKDACPKERGTFTMYIDGHWLSCRIKEEDRDPSDPVRDLDVSILQEKLLRPVLGIGNPKTAGRLDFVGGIRGMEELVRRCSEDCAVAFALYPPSIAELFAVADAGRLMPPKSTWFEPKLRSGLFIHEI